MWFKKQIQYKCASSQNCEIKFSQTWQIKNNHQLNKTEWEHIPFEFSSAIRVYVVRGLFKMQREALLSSVMLRTWICLFLQLQATQMKHLTNSFLRVWPPPRCRAAVGCGGSALLFLSCFFFGWEADGSGEGEVTLPAVLFHQKWAVLKWKE